MAKPKITPLPDEHHVARFVPYRKQHRDFETDKLLGALTTAFELRERDKGALSVTWIEHFGPFSNTTCAAAAQIIGKCMGRGKISANAVFAIGLVQNIKEMTKQTGKPARVLHQATKCNPAHAAVRRIDRNEIEILDALAQQAFGELRDATGAVVCTSAMMGISPI